MSNPNIVNVQSIYGGTSYATPATTGATSLVSNASSSSTLIKIDSLTVANITGSAASVTVSVNSAAAGAGTNYYVTYQMNVPANSTMQVIDKNNFVYLLENSSLVVASGTGSALSYIATYETIA